MSVIIGLTGGIGSGKSTVSSILSKLGCFIIDADDISHNALNPGSECYYSVIDAFGKQIINTDSFIDRIKLADIVFAYESKLQTLNAIIHPYVRNTIYSLTDQAAKNEEKWIVWDIPLLVESGYDQEADETLVVTCSLDQRLKRLALRSGMSTDEALSRIRQQLSDEERAMHASYIIDNSGTIENLNKQVENIFNEIQYNYSQK